MSWWREQVIKCKRFYHFAIGRGLNLLLSAYDSVVCDQVKTGSSESQAEELNQKANVRCDWFILPLLLPTPTIWFSLGHKRNFSDGVV